MKKILQGLSVAFLFLPGVFGSNLELSVFDCGQGNAVVARFNKETMILDAGSKARTKFVGFASATGDCSEVDLEFSLLEEGAPIWLEVSDPEVPERTKKADVVEENKWFWQSFSEEVFGGSVLHGETAEKDVTILHRTLKGVFISHPDVDHYSLLSRLIRETPPSGRPTRFGGVPILLGGERATYDKERFKIKSALQSINKEYRPYIICNHKKSVDFFLPLVPSFKDAEEGVLTVKILTVNAVKQQRKKRNPNLDSMVVKVSMHGRSFLMPGDAEDKTWKSVEKDGGGHDPLQSDVFLVSHH